MQASQWGCPSLSQSATLTAPQRPNAADMNLSYSGRDSVARLTAAGLAQLLPSRPPWARGCQRGLADDASTVRASMVNGRESAVTPGSSPAVILDERPGPWLFVKPWLPGLRGLVLYPGRCPLALHIGYILLSNLSS